MKKKEYIHPETIVHTIATCQPLAASLEPQIYKGTFNEDDVNERPTKVSESESSEFNGWYTGE